MSLARSFMFAGAPRVIASLWNVDDDATAFLMKEFYREWLAGRGTADALRRAQLAVRDHTVTTTVEKAGKPETTTSKPWSAPKFWAAWVLWGLPD
jgi:CHAT domain-containing protein